MLRTADKPELCYELRFVQVTTENVHLSLIASQRKRLEGISEELGDKNFEFKDFIALILRAAVHCTLYYLLN